MEKIPTEELLNIFIEHEGKYEKGTIILYPDGYIEGIIQEDKDQSSLILGVSAINDNSNIVGLNLFSITSDGNLTFSSCELDARGYYGKYCSFANVNGINVRAEGNIDIGLRPHLYDARGEDGLLLPKEEKATMICQKREALQEEIKSFIENSLDTTKELCKQITGLREIIINAIQMKLYIKIDEQFSFETTKPSLELWSNAFLAAYDEAFTFSQKSS